MATTEELQINDMKFQDKAEAFIKAWADFTKYVKTLPMMVDVDGEEFESVSPDLMQYIANKFEGTGLGSADDFYDILEYFWKES